MPENEIAIAHRSKAIEDLAEEYDTTDFGERWEQMPEANFEIDLERPQILIVLHDGTSGGDLTHIQAMGDTKDGFALFDYLCIEQADGKSWIGQIVQPNQNISTVGGRLDPTILHGLQLMQKHKNVQSVESVQVFDILILGQYDGQHMSTPRVRPLPGAIANKLDAEATCNVIEIPPLQKNDKSSNVIGELLNADDVPLCMDADKFNYHIMVAGGTGSGKSNAAANLIEQAIRFGKCVLVHDAKPDYGLVDKTNTDSQVEAVWERFAKYNLQPHGAGNVIRIGFNGKCDAAKVNEVVGFRASDFSPEMLASFFFTGSSPAEQNGYEAFAGAADILYQEVLNETRAQYTLKDILSIVERRMDVNQTLDPREQINKMTGDSVLRKVSNRQRGMKWLDSVGQPVGSTLPTNTANGAANGQSSRRLQGAVRGGATQQVKPFVLRQYVQAGRLIVIDYAQMDEQSYALFLSYFLRECQLYRKRRHPVGLVQLVDEAHRVFDNDSRHSGTLARSFERVMREGRSVDHSIILSLQNASQIPPRVMNNLNSKIVMRQNSKAEADAATQTMGRDFATQAMRLGTGHALVSLYESRATVLAQMAPSPYELMRNDNTAPNQIASFDDDFDY